MNKLPLDIYRPETERHQDTAALYAYSFNANPGNSGERLQTLANLAGITVYAADFMGQQNGKIMGQPVRTALKPGHHFRHTFARQADMLADTEFASWPLRIGIGDSLGVTAIAALHNHGKPHRLFSGVELRDGFNWRTYQFVPFVPQTGYLGYLAANAVRDKVRSRHDDNYEMDKVSDESSIWPRDSKEISVLSKIRKLAPLMRSRDSYFEAMGVAEDAGVAMQMVAFTHGISGKRFHELQILRWCRLTRAVSALIDTQDNPDFRPLPLQTVVEDGWHSDLLDPRLAARHLEATRALINPPAIS